MTSVGGEIVHAPTYSASVGNRGDVFTTPGLMNHVGSIVTDLVNPTGPGEFLLFTVPMTADAAGTITFLPDEAKPDVPLFDVLLFGDPEGEGPYVPPDRVDFVPITLRSVPEPGSVLLAALAMLRLLLQRRP